MIEYWIGLAFVFFVALLSQKIFIGIARRWRILNVPNLRRQHERSTPTLGGLAILLTWIIALFLVPFQVTPYIPWMVAACGIGFLGLLDDLYGLSATPKLIVEFCVAGLLLYFDPLTHQSVMAWQGQFGIVVWIFAAVWIAGVSNTINLIDGVDGLAAITSLLTCLGIFIISLYSSHSDGRAMIPIALLMTSIMGFLVFNWSPAKVFMGDNGSLSLGFLLAVFSINTVEAAPVGICVLMVLFAYPICDMGLAVWRRARKRQPLFQADRVHLHHRLLRLGLSVSEVCIVLTSIVLFFQVAAINLAMQSFFSAVQYLIVASLTLMALVYVIRCIEKSRIRRLLSVFRASRLENKNRVQPVMKDIELSRQKRVVYIDLEPLSEAGSGEEKSRYRGLVSSLELMIKSNLGKNDTMNVSSEKIWIHLDSEMDKATHIEKRFKDKINQFLMLYNLQCSTQSLSVSVQDKAPPKWKDLSA